VPATAVPVLLQAGLSSYRRRVQAQLAAAGFNDLPRGGPFVLGAVANGGGAAGDVIRQLGISKQAASKLIDTLVVRGYLERRADPNDRRRFALVPAERGRAAARVIGAAVRAVDGELARNLSARDLAGLQKGLAVLAGLDVDRRP
jgi:DNA-binding MarR family transcriptional regulator